MKIPPLVVKLIKWGIILGLVVGILVGAAVAGAFYYYGQDLPDVISREDFKPPQMSRVLSAEGEVIAEFYTPGAKRTIVSMEKIPDHVKHAFMAAEDADFYKHEGIDYLGLVRAVYYAVFYDTGMKGTSTITQQVIKNLVLTPERSYKRKIKEFILARELEKNLKKDDILYLYLNTMYLGHGVNGVEEASRMYFGKSVVDLSISEAAMLAGLTQSPERHSPVRHPERAEKRRKFVLEQLWQKGFIEEAPYRKALKVLPKIAKKDQVFPYLWIAPHFTEYIRLKLIEEMGEDKVLGGGLTIETTLRVNDQIAAQASAKEGMREYDLRQGWYSALRHLKTDKAIKAHLSKVAKALKKKGVDPLEPYEAVVVKIAKGGIHLRLGKLKGMLDLTNEPRLPTDPEALKKRLLKRGDVIRVAAPKDPNSKKTVKLRYAQGPEISLISLNPHTRELYAVVGSFDFKANQYNHAFEAKLQTGSTFKPIVYGAALESKKVHLATTFLDAPAAFQTPQGHWSPKNADGSWRGSIRVREALGASRNVVSVRILDAVGVENAIEFARKVGITSQLNKDRTLVMGSSELPPLEIINAFATFAAYGKYADPIMITKITSKDDKSVQKYSAKFEQRISPDVAWLTIYVMQATVHGYTDRTGKRRGGTAFRLSKLGHRIAGKTGTTNDNMDAWFIGFTKHRVTGVWVGNSKRRRTLGRREGGGRTAGPIWLAFMQKVLAGQKPEEFVRPKGKGIVDLRIDPESGLRVKQGGIVESFLAGTGPREYVSTDEKETGDGFMMSQFGMEEETGVTEKLEKKLEVKKPEAKKVPAPVVPPKTQ